MKRLLKYMERRWGTPREPDPIFPDPGSGGSGGGWEWLRWRERQRQYYLWANVKPIGDFHIHGDDWWDYAHISQGVRGSTLWLGMGVHF